ncbi:hypothetical protein Ancab_025660 [Ancistrocladus abbreviatus]
MSKPYRDQGVKNFHRVGLITKPMKFKGATYADVLRGNNKPRSVLSHTAFGNHYPPLAPNLELSSKESNYLWLKGCYVGQVCSSIVLSKLGNKMRLNGMRDVLLRPFSGKLVLLSATDKNSMEEILAGDSIKLGKWFNSIRPWSKQDVGAGRIAWLKCYGIPLHNRRRLEFACLAIHTSVIEAIRGILKVKIDENLFHIQVIEEYPNLFSSSGSFDINGDFDMHHPPLQSNFNSYVEESINTSGKTQTRLPEMDDWR